MTQEETHLEAVRRLVEQMLEAPNNTWEWRHAVEISIAEICQHLSHLEEMQQEKAASVFGGLTGGVTAGPIPALEPATPCQHLIAERPEMHGGSISNCVTCGQAMVLHWAELKPVEPHPWAK